MTGIVVDAVAVDAENLLTNTIIDADHRQSFNLHGYAHLSDLWDESMRLALADEARSRHSVAEIPKSGPRTPLAEGRLRGRVTRAATGTLLAKLHLSLLGVVRALSGQLLVPTFSAYGYYEADDETLLHLDSEQCDATLLTTVLGRVGPLHLRRELQGRTMAELGELENDPAWDRDGGLQIEYPGFGLTALRGNVLPHNRPGRPVSELSAVAALCYQSLF